MAKYRDWLKPDGLKQIEEWARDGLTDQQIAHNIGISAGTLYEWKSKYPDFSETLKRGKDIADYEVENALHRRATGYVTIEKTYARIEDDQGKRHGGTQRLTEREWQLCQAYFGHRCCYCGKSAPLTKDHVQPLAHGGKLEMGNILPACQPCNSSKKDREWSAWFKQSPHFDEIRFRRIQEYLSFAGDAAAILEPESGDLVLTKTVEKFVPPDPTSAIFWLKNRKPAEWRDRKGVDVDLAERPIVRIIDDIPRGLIPDDIGE